MFVGVAPAVSIIVLGMLGFPLFGIFLWGAVIAVILAIVGFIATGQNPWIKAIQGDAIIVIDVNSTGVGKFYTAQVKNNPFGGIDLDVDFGGGKYETRVYDRKVTHRIQSPIKFIMQPWKRKQVKPIEPNVEVKPNVQ